MFEELIKKGNTIVSFFLGCISVLQLILEVPKIYVLLTLSIIILLWLSMIIVFFVRSPWHKSMRPQILKPNNIRKMFSLLFMKPLYEPKYTCPKYGCKLVRDIECNDDFVNSKITVIVEDDPVGYISNLGCIFPAIAVNEDFTCNDLLSEMISMKSDIQEKRLFFHRNAKQKVG